MLTNPGKLIRFLVDNKTLQKIPLYNNFRNYLIYRYKKEILSDIVKIGDYTINNAKIVTASYKNKLIIGNFCSIATGSSIILSSSHRTDWISTYPLIHTENKSRFDHFDDGHQRGIISGKGNIVIGNDVWIGINAIILPGVKIGDGAVIGAGSVITKNVDDYEVVAGNPAKHIRYRFSNKEITALKKIKWWDWPLEKIIENRHFIESDNIKNFTDEFLYSN